jgi:hypothetical protein
MPFAAAALEARTPVMELRVFGVIVTPPDTDELIIIVIGGRIGLGPGLEDEGCMQPEAA